MPAEALHVLEISAILLTLIFISLQFAARSIDRSDVSADVYLPALRSVNLLTVALISASFFGLVWAGRMTDQGPAILAITALVFAIMMLEIAIQWTARAIMRQHRAEESSPSNDNVEQEQTEHPNDG